MTMGNYLEYRLKLKNEGKDAKLFIVHQPDTIPDRSTDQAMIAHNFSDWFMAKIEGMTGRITYAIIAYNFSSGEWLAIQAGMKRVIEYYTEVPETEIEKK